jgi:hypothetical protein
MVLPYRTEERENKNEERFPLVAIRNKNETYISVENTYYEKWPFRTRSLEGRLL